MYSINRSLFFTMLSTKIFFLVFLLVPVILSHSFAQNEANRWYFGSNAGIDFNSGSPVSITNSSINTDEGSSGICDNSGNLLFYTDGITVWNKNNNVMMNGTGLHGGISSTQSALVIKKPGIDSIYYIFTTGALVSYGLEYSIVNMSLQNGNGEVTLKNINLFTQCTEKLTATRNSNGTDIWVITHGWNNNNFYAYAITEAGLDAIPVTSSSGTICVNNIASASGQLKASVTGKKLAQAVYFGNYFECYDFDNLTGLVSNAVNLSSNANGANGAYGVEFSPDESKLYGSLLTSDTIFQWNLNAGSAADIIASKTSIGISSAGAFVGSLQLAPDNKIYIAQYYSNWLAIIHEPDNIGTSCNFTEYGFQLTNGIVRYGLPDNLYSPYLPSPQVVLSVSDNKICEKFCADFTDLSINNPTSWYWLFPGGTPSSSTEQNPNNICYYLPGIYDVTLFTFNANEVDSLTLYDYITVSPTPAIPTITQNGNLLISSYAEFYKWQFNTVDIPGATNQTYFASETGYYTVIVSDSLGCISSTTSFFNFTGIESLINNEGFIIYPNPSNAFFNIDLQTYPGHISGIRIFNSTGTLIYSESDEGQPDHFLKIVQIRGLSPGIYFLELAIKHGLLRKKLIIAE